jgi:hypothetical protein
VGSASFGAQPERVSVKYATASGDAMSAERDEFLLLQRLAPEDHGLTVFDAETQETSYGTLVVDGMPLIFDTHRKEASYVSTAELLTEIVAPASATPEEVARFAKVAEHTGAQVLPYSACFFKGNLHVYAYFGPVRGLDLSVVAGSVPDAEAKLDARLRTLWSEIPAGVVEAQRQLLAGKRKARYPADLEVLLRRSAAFGAKA